MHRHVATTLKLFLALLGFAIAFIGAFLFVGWPTKTSQVTYGVTFSRPYAESLGLNPDKTLRIALDDIGIRRFRIPAYWKNLEPVRGKWNFSTLDAEISQIKQRGGKVVLAIGEKLPRWPECWEPGWWKKLPRDQQEQQTLRYIETVMTHYRNNPTIIEWQIENEPHFAYGDCPPPDYLFIQQETEFARGLDATRPIVTTDSGELSSWLTLGVFVDKLGISVYRVVRSPFLGDTNLRYWFIPPYLYKRKAILLRPLGVKDVYVSEFQMEPWSNTDLVKTSIADQLSSMSLKQMKSNFSFAERMGFHTIDFWGVEWWIYMSEHGHPEFLRTAEAFWKSHSGASL